MDLSVDISRRTVARNSVLPAVISKIVPGKLFLPGSMGWFAQKLPDSRLLPGLGVQNDV